MFLHVKWVIDAIFIWDRSYTWTSILHVVKNYLICAGGLWGNSYNEPQCIIPYIEVQYRHFLKIHLRIYFTHVQKIAHVCMWIFRKVQHWASRYESKHWSAHYHFSQDSPAQRFYTWSKIFEKNWKWSFLQVLLPDLLVRHLYSIAMCRYLGKSIINGQTFFCSESDLTFHPRNNFSDTKKISCLKNYKFTFSQTVY